MMYGITSNNVEFKMQMFNTKTTAWGAKNVFALKLKNVKCKELLKSAVISCLRNAKSHKLKPMDFVSYFHFCCAENDIDSIKQLQGNKDETVLHAACTADNGEIFKFLVAHKECQDEALAICNKDGMNVLSILADKGNHELFQVVVDKLKANRKLLASMVAARANYGGNCVEKELQKGKTDCTFKVLAFNKAQDGPRTTALRHQEERGQAKRSGFQDPVKLAPGQGAFDG